MKKLSLLLGLLSAGSLAHAMQYSGRVGLETRFFTDDSEYQNSVLAEPEFYWEDASGDNNFTVELFGRWDELDDERTHFDVREAAWLHVGSTWEMRLGVSKVFWGVTESNHLVDVVNQTDLVESPDGEQKLGQPMLQYTAIRDWGVIDAFVLPWFRERTFPGPDGRLNGLLPINADEASYESDQEQQHLDFALRYSQSISVFDIGLSWFKGTNRDPHLVAYSEANTPLELRPYYDQMQQLGIDVQATTGDWLWKLEAIARDDSVRDYGAFTAGFEYTWVGFAGSAMDLGLLSEASRDSRNNQAPTPSEKDVFFGTRFTFNDAASSDLLLGYSRGINEPKSYALFAEGSRRFGNNWRTTLDARIFNGERPDDPVYQFNDDDYISLTVEFFY
ncbi:hypothetical protein [Agaribacterium haliotis]|uniref:hypothetical protein n=1 Tax=Agaribacterium haliotis TaxID=2013869 RepID=UPI000BB56537|nr:hypothetical protein [Agaribacterium haliotis]